MPLTRFPYGSQDGPLTVYTGATDAIQYPGTAVINRSGAVDACTLATPVAGDDYSKPPIQGDDDKNLTIINGAAEANTVTLAAGKLLDGTITPKHIITFAAVVGATIKLKAYNGFWMVIANSGATLT